MNLGSQNVAAQNVVSQYEAESKTLNVAIHGRFDFKLINAFREACKNTQGTTLDRVNIDFRETDYMDSSGLGTIVKLYVSGRTSGCTVSLVNFNRRVRELLGMTNLLRVFETCADRTARMT